MILSNEWNGGRDAVISLHQEQLDINATTVDIWRNAVKSHLTAPPTIRGSRPHARGDNGGRIIRVRTTGKC